MSSDVELHAAYKVANAPLNMFPYPHFYVEDIFPKDFYATLQTMLPTHSDMRPIAEVRPVKGYKERFVLDLGSGELSALPETKQRFWNDVRKWLIAGRFSSAVAGKFGQQLNERFGSQPAEFYDEALLVQDITNYALGPHSDAPRKVITLLFYLPKDESQKHLGTSLYVPKDPNFSCPGGPHYPHDRFDRVWTMPFLPNALFAFAKTDRSFHGVEPIADEDCRRWLLLYDVYLRQAQPAAVEAQSATPKKVKFFF
jgi:hypothetical protein